MTDLDSVYQRKLCSLFPDPGQRSETDALLIQTILNGRTGHQQNVEGDEITLMPALTFLSNAEIVAIIAFITNSWGGEVLAVTDQEVQEARIATGIPGAGSRPGREIALRRRRPPE